MIQDKPHVALINYGVGNLLSVSRAIEATGVICQIIESAEEIAAAKSLILPGVGAFRHCMNELEKRGLRQAIIQYANDKKPLLGICVGMQMLLDSSEEDGLTKGLGLIPGRVIAIAPATNENKIKKVPHIGWSSLYKNPDAEDTLFNDSVTADENVYFVHSYKGVTTDKKHTTMSCDYMGEEICAAIQSDNIYGLQFHPEKSGQTGLKILKNFIELS